MSSLVDDGPLPSSGHGQGWRSLGDLVATMPADRFAVVDGALFNDIQLDLRLHGLLARPLFLEAGDADAVASGPFLMRVSTSEDIGRVLQFNGSRRSPVFWSWPAGEVALYRHLRTLNLVEIPDENRLSEDAPAYETVIFRHWDSIVLGQTLPLLRPEQMARFLGAAAGIGFDAGLAGGLIGHGPRAVLGAPEMGMLRFSVEQVNGLKAGRMRTSRLKVLRYLEEVDPEPLEGVPSQARLQRVLDYERSGNAHGLVSERAHMKWAYLNSISDGEIAKSPETRTFFRNRPDHPDVAIDVLMDELDRVWPTVRR